MTCLRLFLVCLLALAHNSLCYQNICVVGGGFGGLYTALKLDKLYSPKDVSITLIDPKDKFVFLPLLYELVADSASIVEVAPRFNELLADTNIQLVNGLSESIDMNSRTVTVKQHETSSTTVPYDKLVLACGAQPNMDTINGLKDHAIPFARVEDAFRLQVTLKKLLQQKEMSTSSQEPLKFAILGGGYSGIEIASTLSAYLRNRKVPAEVSIFDRNDRIMKSSTDFNRQSSLEALSKLNVDVKTSVNIRRVSEDGLYYVPKNDPDPNGEGEFFPADVVIATLGMNQSPLLNNIPGIRRDASSGRISTSRSLQSLSDPSVFALGDCALVDGMQLPCTAQVAMQQSEIVSKNIELLIRDERDKVRVPSRLEKFCYVPLGEMLTLGANKASVSSLGGLLELSGPVASAARRLVYSARMPTQKQQQQALVSSVLSQTLVAFEELAALIDDK
jgi:demethylphylloquinone reductase